MCGCVPNTVLIFASNSINIYQVSRIFQNILSVSGITTNRTYSTVARETLKNDRSKLANMEHVRS